MATRIVRTHNDDFHLVPEYSGDITEAYRRLKTLLQEYNIEKSITLFAKPVKTDDAHVEWYTDFSDQPVSLVDLPEEQQEQIKKIIMDKGQAISLASERIPQDDPARKIIESALLFPDERNIFALNGQPVITAWGHQIKDAPPLSIQNFSPRVLVTNTDAVEEKEEKPRRGLWWLWLLLLLLLLLAALFFWLKPCRHIPFTLPYICPVVIAEVDFDFPDVADAQSDSTIISDIIKITDIPDETPVSLKGFKTPEYRICADGTTPETCDASMSKDWGNQPGAINQNEFIQIRLHSALKEEETHRAYLTIGKSSDQWDVTTEKLLHGICGDGQEQTFETKKELEEAGLCASESPASSVFDTDTGWTWTCPPPSENATEATCLAERKEIQHGACGSAEEQEFELIEDLKKAELCASEKPASSIFDTDAGWSWTCPPASEKNGETATCSVKRKEIENGMCGKAHNASFETAENLKEAELCTSLEHTTEPSETDTGWAWTCPSPSVNGTEASCSAKRKEEEEPKEDTSEFDRRVKNAGGKRGEVQITLLWDSYNDLDVHVYCPNKAHIWYKAKNGCRGVLDVDANADQTNPFAALMGVRARSSNPPTRSPVENVTWVNGAPSGTYQVYVKHYQHRGGPEPTPYRVRIRVKDKEEIYKGTVKQGQSKLIANFTVP